MALWNRLFDRSSPSETLPEFEIGRYTDAYKAPVNYKHWDQAIVYFEKEEYREAVVQFLHYLSDQGRDNVVFDEIGRELNFSIVQGSNRIMGSLSGSRLFAESVLVKSNQHSTEFLHNILNKNYHLNYCRYALNENGHLMLVFESFIQDANPYKLYFALKELAIHADKMDDLIKSELQGIDTEHNELHQPLPENTKEQKTRFYYAKLQKLKYELDEGYLSNSSDPTNSIYAILAVFYKIDFLLLPHGRSIEIIEQAHKAYFSDQTVSVVKRLGSLKKALDDLLSISEQDINKEWYNVTYTFGINPSIDHLMIKPKIENDLSKVDWYISENKFDEAGAIIEFVVGYLFFDYALDPFIHDLLTLYYQVVEESFFNSVGFTTTFRNKKGGLNKNAIKSSVDGLIERHKNAYHSLDLDAKLLECGSTYHFGQSLLHLLLQSSFVIKSAAR